VSPRLGDISSGPARVECHEGIVIPTSLCRENDIVPPLECLPYKDSTVGSYSYPYSITPETPVHGPDVPAV
jgi:hypothetical protein